MHSKAIERRFVAAKRLLLALNITPKAVRMMTPPLAGVRVVEFEGIGPGPLAGRMLADMGARVTVIARPQKGAVTEQIGGAGDNPLRRGKSVVLLDLKHGRSRSASAQRGARHLHRGRRRHLAGSGRTALSGAVGRLTDLGA